MIRSGLPQGYAFVARRITKLVREAPPKRRAAILKIARTLSRPD